MRRLRSTLPLVLLLATSSCASGSIPEASVRIVAPRDGETVRGEVGLRIALRPASRVQTVDLFVDDQPIAWSTGPFYPEERVAWDSTAVDNAIHELRVEARFQGGQRLSDSVLVVVDNERLGIRITEPLARIYREDEFFVFGVTVDDPTEIVRLELKVDERTVEVLEPVESATQAVRVGRDELTLDEGTERVSLVATALTRGGLVREARREVEVASRHLWRFETVGAVWVRPEPLPGGAVAVLTSTGTLHVVEPNGRERCKVRADGEDGIGAPRYVPEAEAVAWGTSRRLRLTSVTDCMQRYEDPLVSEFTSRPAVGPGGRVSAVTLDGRLVSFGPDGSGRVEVDLGSALSGGGSLQVWSAPAVAPDGTVFVVAALGSGGVLLAVAPDGAVRSADVTAPARGAVLWHEGLVVFAAEDGATYAYGDDLVRRWVAVGGDATPVRASVAFDGVHLVTEDGQGEVRGLDPGDGGIRWTFDSLGGTALGGVSVIGRAGFAAAPGRGLVAFADAVGRLQVLRSDGLRVLLAQVAEGSAGRGVRASPAFGEDRLFVGLEEQALVAFDVR